MCDRELNPQVALEAAWRETDEGAYAEALENLQWFFRHAVEIDPSFIGVRRSFLLASWAELAELHAPARDALDVEFERARDAAISNGDYEAFADAEAIATRTGRDAELVELMKSLQASHPEFAVRVYPRVCLKMVELDAHRDFCALLTSPRSLLEREATILSHMAREFRKREHFDALQRQVDRFSAHCRLLQRHLRDCGSQDDDLWIEETRTRAIEEASGG